MVQSIRRNLFPRFWSSVTRTKKLHTQRHKKSLCTIILVLSSLTSARTITHHMEKELTLCCINLTTNCCRALSPVYCLLLEKKITADHAGSCGDICMGKWFFRRLDRWELEGNAYFLFYQRGNELVLVTFPSNERPWTLLRWLCCVSMIRSCSHGGRTRGFF